MSPKVIFEVERRHQSGPRARVKLSIPRVRNATELLLVVPWNEADHWAAYLGGCRPGELHQSSIRDAMSA
jgi:hypothetical protein